MITLKPEQSRDLEWRLDRIMHIPASRAEREERVERLLNGYVARGVAVKGIQLTSSSWTRLPSLHKPFTDVERAEICILSDILTIIDNYKQDPHPDEAMLNGAIRQMLLDGEAFDMWTGRVVAEVLVLGDGATVYLSDWFCGILASYSAMFSFDWIEL